MITAAVCEAVPPSSSVAPNVVSYAQAPPNVCESVLVTSRGWMLGLTAGSGSGGFTSDVVDEPAVPSPQAQASVRSSLPGSVERPLKPTAAPDRSSTAVGLVFVTCTGNDVHGFVSSSAAQTCTVKVPLSP